MKVYELQKITSIKIKGLTKEEERIIEKKFRGYSFFLLLCEDIPTVVRGLLPQYEIIDTTVQFPNKMTILARKTYPLAYLRTDIGYLALSPSGYVLEKKRGNEFPNPLIILPYQLYHADYQQGQTVRISVLSKTLLFIQTLRNSGLIPISVDIDSVDMIACKMKDNEIIFSQSREINQQIHEFRQIYRNTKTGMMRFKKLDLRFDKPLLQFK